MIAKVRRLGALILFLLAFCGLWPAALFLAPKDVNYCFAYIFLLAFLFIFTYYVPKKALYLFCFLLPLSGIFSRFLEIGAHQPVIFLGLAFALGYWANRLVTGKTSLLDQDLKLPLLLLILAGVSSSFWTAARYGNFIKGYATPFFYDRIVNTSGETASHALKVTVLHGFLFLALPALLWAVFSVLKETKEEEREAYVSRLWKTMLLGLAPIIALGAYQHFVNSSFAFWGDQNWIDENRVSGGMSDPNALGLFLALSIPLSVYFAFKGKLREKFFFLLFVIFSLPVMMYSGSRSSLLFLLSCLAFSAFFYAVNYLKKRALGKKQFLMLLGCLALFFVFAATLPGLKLDPRSSNPVVARIARQLNRHRSEKGISFFDRREIQWKQAWRIWKEYPLEGVGLGAFPLEVVNYNREAGEETPSDNPWNQYLTWGVELGLLGILIWGYLFFLFFKKAKNSQAFKEPFSLRVCLGAVFLAFLLISFFGTHLNAPEVTALVALLLAFFLTDKDHLESAPLRMRSLLTAGLLLVVFNFIYAFAVFGKLGAEERRERFSLPEDFGLYTKEAWQGNAFYYRWSAPKAGILLEVPEDKRILKLRLAAVREDVSSENFVAVTFFYDGELIDTIILNRPEWQEIKLNIFPWLPDKALLCFAVSRVWHPEGEMRDLGVALACDYEFVSDFSRQAQGLLGYEITEKGLVAVLGKGMSWQPSLGSQTIRLDFEMPLRKPLEPLTQTYTLYQGKKILETFSYPFDGQEHTFLKEFPDEDRSALSLRADKLLRTKVKDRKETVRSGGRIRAIGDF